MILLTWREYGYIEANDNEDTFFCIFFSSLLLFEQVKAFYNIAKQTFQGGLYTQCFGVGWSGNLTSWRLGNLHGRLDSSEKTCSLKLFWNLGSV